MNMWHITRADYAGKIHLSIKGNVKIDGTFDWASAVLDSAILSGITFCSGLGALAAANAVSFTGIIVLISSVGAEFLGIIATKRGLSAPRPAR